MESTDIASVNRELIASEIEALSMTLNERELKVEGGDGSSIDSVLVLSRRPSKDDWKEKNIKSLEMSVMPKNQQGGQDSELFNLELVNEKG